MVVQYIHLIVDVQESQIAVKRWLKINVIMVQLIVNNKNVIGIKIKWNVYLKYVN